METAAGEYLLTVLHVSDLHARGPREQEGWRRRRVLGEAWERNLDDIARDRVPDLAVFTGDAADWGLPAEYAQATEFLTSMLERLGLGADRLFVIPGNHDVHRPHEGQAWQSVRDSSQHGDRLAFSRWMAGGPPPPGLSDALREAVGARLAAFRDWVRHDLGRPELDPGRSGHGRLGYRAAPRLPFLPFPVQVIGFDTAWLSGDDADTTHLWLTEDQVMRLATDSTGGPLPGLRLGLMHHPFHDLADGADCRRLIAGHIDLVLRGHLHEPEAETWADPDRTVRQLAAGCLYEGERADYYPNSCQVVTLRLDADGAILAAEIRFRSWSRRSGRWYDDNSVYDGSENGRRSWSFTLSRRMTVKGNPFDPWTPATSSRLHGRAPYLRWLALALDQGRSVSLVGDRRIGKTSLLQAWAERASHNGRRIALLSGEGAEGASPDAFVSTATERPAPVDADGAADALSLWATLARSPGTSTPPLLIVDEADSLLARFDHRFFERLRGMLGKICLVFASRRELDLIYEELGRTSPFHNRLQLQWLGLLEPDAAEGLVQDGATLLSPADLALMRFWAGRNPFYIQLLGWNLVEAQQSGEHQDAALDRFRTEAASRLRDLWRVLGEREREALRRTLSGVAVARRALRVRGLVDDQGNPFGQVLLDWLREENP